MVSIARQHDAKPLQKLKFCYLCGKAVTADQQQNQDHLPPKSLFEIRDRGSPLKLPTHIACHSPLNHADDDMRQLVGLLNGKAPRFDGDTTPIDLKGNIWRWVRGFHAALYQQHLPASSPHTIQPPLASGRVVEGQMQIDPILKHHLLIVATIKRNRSDERLDRIVLYNGRLRYECVWVKADDGLNWLCMFALDVYGWIRLGAHPRIVPRGCCGAYWIPDAKLPSSATVDTSLQLATSNKELTDPFGM